MVMGIWKPEARWPGQLRSEAKERMEVKDSGVPSRLALPCITGRGGMGLPSLLSKLHPETCPTLRPLEATLGPLTRTDRLTPRHWKSGGL